VGVLPDVPAIDRVFDYLVPEDLAEQVSGGTIVRVPLQGRRVRGWIVEEAGRRPPPDVTLRAIAGVSGWGPPAPVIELARWAAWRWAGRTATFLRTASPDRAVPSLPPPPCPRRPGSQPDVPLAGDALAGPKSVLRLPPAHDPFAVVAAAAARGPALVLVPSVAAAAATAERLRDLDVPVALLPRDWAQARAGGCTVVGTRTAAWAPLPDLASVVVVDGHDEAYRQERAPTWNGRLVASERARRAGAPCVVVSPCPDLETLAWGPLLVPARKEEREGWPVLDVVDRRPDDPRTGLYGERLVTLLRSGRRVVCVLNRKGRGRLLACASCGGLARCERCSAAVEQVDGAGGDEGAGLRCRRCGHRRPLLCTVCGSGRLRILRAGVSRAREELEALAGRPVGQVTGDSTDVPGEPLLLGTEAVLHRAPAADAVAFLDFDQELLAPTYRAPERALALLARAGRLVGGRRSGGRVVVQTRLPDHAVLAAALHGDPGRLAAAESARRAALRLPPSAALALVSGPAAAALVGRLTGVEVLGPDEDRWLVRAGDHQALCEALAAAPRPPGRLRVEVDPSVA
jgi:primosomal protein N' (replication factor Y)